MDLIYYWVLFLCVILGVLAILVFADPRYDIPAPEAFYEIICRDLSALIKYVRGRVFELRCSYKNKSVPKLFQESVRRHPNKACFLYEDQIWTFQQVEDFSNRIANYFDAEGFQKGDEVALLMENKPEYVAIWIGLSKIGVIPALINTNLRLNPLAHSVHAIRCKALIYGGELDSAVHDVIPLLENKETLKYFRFGGNEVPDKCPATSLENVLKDVSTHPPDTRRHKIGFSDKLFYIYTSGTTGLPKAAVIRHSRFVLGALLSHFFMGVESSDVVYNPLPLYHTAGGVLILSSVFAVGTTMAIRKKFSASNFWTDCIKFKATVAQYIGEICRFLLAQPKKPHDTQHMVRMMCGNGLRSQVWTEFAERFKIEKLMEFYGATEGNANVVNLTGKVGAVGFLPRPLSFLYPVTLVRSDPETGELKRDANGLCMPCKPGEPGHMIGKIISGQSMNAFDGYLDKKATQKKIVRDCFRKGDMAFLSGDILVMDECGYLYFVDRTGDTFRWRGENVSTNEVESVVSKLLGQVACAVYGVEVPGTEGRAGMAAIQLSVKEFDVLSFYNKIKAFLPAYAIPVFLRICSDIEATGTYKIRKVELQKEGYDPGKAKEPLFFLDPKTRSYVRLDTEIFQHIMEGKVKL